MKCTHKSIFHKGFDPAYVCLMVTSHELCKEDFKFVNLMDVFWCKLEGSYYIFIPLALVALFLIFKYIAIAVEEYIAEGIQAICDRLGLSDSVAAITLLAVANGAADMMTVLISSETEGGISYNIGTLYGGGLFICSAVLALCILQSKRRLRFNWMIIYRLIIFYMLATLMTIAFAIYKHITWWSAASLLALYFFLVIVVIRDDKLQSKKNLSESMDAGPQLNISVDESKDKDSHQLPSRIHSKIFNLHQKVVDPEYQEENRETGDIQSIHTGSKITNPLLRSTAPINLEGKGPVFTFHEHHSMTQDFRHKIDFARELRKKKIEGGGFFGWLSYCIEKPFIWLMYLTVLPCDKDHYSKARCLLFAFPGMFFTVFTITHKVGLIEMSIVGGGGLLLFILFWFTLDPVKPPKYFLLINIMGLLGGLMWTYILVTSMIDIIESFGIILNLNKTFLGLTIMAIGSSIPDAFTTIHLCRESESIMAISGAYSGQLFALTIAFGISMLKITLTEGPQDFDLFDEAKLSENILNILVIFSNLLVLGSTFVYAVRKNFKLERSFGIGLISFYAIFLGACCWIGIRYAIRYF